MQVIQRIVTVIDEKLLNIEGIFLIDGDTIYSVFKIVERSNEVRSTRWLSIAGLYYGLGSLRWICS